MRYEKEVYRRSISNLQSAFGQDKTWVYLIPTDTYNGQTSLGLCFKGDAHPDNVSKDRIKAFTSKNEMKYYNYKIHKASTVLPQYLKNFMGVGGDKHSNKT